MIREKGMKEVLFKRTAAPEKSHSVTQAGDTLKKVAMKGMHKLRLAIL